MTAVVLDLEWNSAFCPAVNGYFNEIIEIGAVRLNRDFTVAERFDAVIRPQNTRHLSQWVTKLTGYTDEQVRRGTTFGKALAQFRQFLGDESVLLLTWSNTDLLVLMENFRFHFGHDTIPFMGAYLDLQAYAQQRLSLDAGRQVSLLNFAELVGLDSTELSLHHAVDDSLLSARILQRVHEPASFAAAVRVADEDFYRRLTFKPTYVSELDDPAVRAADFRFRCPSCRRPLKRRGDWVFRHRQFQAPLHCNTCGADFSGRVRIRRLYDGPQTKRWLVPLPAPESAPEPASSPAAQPGPSQADPLSAP